MARKGPSIKLEAYKPSAKELFVSLECEHQWLDLLKGKDYEALIPIIQRQAQRGEDEPIEQFSIKAIAAEIGVTSLKITKWLNQIYDDLFELNAASPELFKAEGKKYNLYFTTSYNNQSAFFNLWLDNPLRKGERFSWSFLKAKLDTNLFYVDHVDHEFTNGRQVSLVYLKAGFANHYREFVLNKAKFIGQLSLEEEFYLNDYELDRILLTLIEGIRPRSYDESEKPVYPPTKKTKGRQVTGKPQAEASSKRRAKRTNT